MYEVICAFRDLEDGGRVYKVGAKYPRKGYKPSEARINELSGDKNKVGKPLIADMKPEKEPEKE